MAGEGVIKRQEYLDAGFTLDEVEQWEGKKRAELNGAGFNAVEVNEYFGDIEPDMSTTKGIFETNLKTLQEGAEGAQQIVKAAPSGTVEEVPGQIQSTQQDDVKHAEGFWEAAHAGFQSTGMGMWARGKLPTTVLPENAEMYQRIAAAAGMYVGDVIPMQIGGKVAKMAAAPLIAEFQIGAPFASVAAEGFGSFALPAALRRVLIDHYQKGSVKSFGDFWERTAGLFIDTLRGGLIGATTMGVGNKVAGAFAKPLVKTAAQLSAEVATMTTVGAALHGQVPEPEEYLEGAIFLTLMHGTTSGKERVVGKLQKIWAETAIKPRQIVEQAEKDPTILQDLLSENVEIPKAYQAFQEPSQAKELTLPKALTKESELVGGEQETVKVPAPKKASVLFHGTKEDFNDFDFERSGGMTFFAEKESDAARYAQGGGGQRKRLGAEDLYVVDDKGVAFEKKGELWEPVGRVDDTAPLQNKDSLLPLDREVAPLTQEQAEAITHPENGDGYSTPKESRIVKKTFEDLKLLDTTKPEGVKFISQLEVTTPVAKALIEAAKSDVKDNGTVQFNTNFWSTTKFSQAKKAGLSEITSALKKAGYDGIRFADDMHTSVGLFESAMKLLKSESGAVKLPEKEAPDPDAEAILTRMGRVEKPGIDLSPSRIYKDFFDANHPLNEITKVLKGETKDLSIMKDPYKLGRLNQATDSLVMEWLRRGGGTTDFHTVEKTGKSFEDILRPVRKTPRKFQAFMVARRVVELEGRGVRSGMPLEESKRFVEKYKKEFEQTAKELTDFSNASVDYLVQSGILSAEKAEIIKEANKSFVPFKRLFEDSPTPGAPGRKGLAIRNPIKSIKDQGKALIKTEEQRAQDKAKQKKRGGDIVPSEEETTPAPIVDIYDSIVGNTQHIIKLAEQNRVNRALVELAAANPKGNLFVEHVPTPMRPVEVTAKELSHVFDQEGIGDVEAKAFDIFRPLNKSLDADQMAAFIDGQRYVFRLDPGVAEALRGLGPDSGLKNLVVKALSIPAKTLKFGAITNPEFAVKNPLVDALTAWVFEGAIPVYTQLLGMSSFIREDAHYRNWLAGRGSMKALDNVKGYVDDRVYKWTKESGILSDIWNGIKTPFQAAGVALEMTEAMTRIGVARQEKTKYGFMVQKKATKNPEVMMRDALRSREGTVDFLHQGARMKVFNSITSFSAVSLGGLDRTFRSFKDDFAGATARAACLAVPSAVLWALNHNDERYKELPRRVKNLYWVFPTDKWEPISERELDDRNIPEWLRRKSTRMVEGVEQHQWEINNGHLFKFPKPREVGVIFGSLVERTLEAYFDENPRAFKSFGETLMATLTPNYMPNGPLAIAEHLSNHNFFTERPIVNYSNERLFPELQFTEYTTETAKLLGHYISKLPGQRMSSFASPAILQNYVRAWGGGLGFEALQVADLALIKSGVVPDPVKPELTWADMPITKAFVQRFPSMDTQSIKDFMDRYKENEKYIESEKHIIDTNDEARFAFIERLRLENPDKFIDLTDTKKALGNMNSMVQKILQDKEMKPREKRQLIDGMYYGMMETARGGNEMMDELEKELKKADAK